MKEPAYWLSYAFNTHLGAFIAIASSKHPALSDPETNVLASSFEPDEESCKRWFEEWKRGRNEKS